MIVYLSKKLEIAAVFSLVLLGMDGFLFIFANQTIIL